jgi:hypothetical protein
MILQMEKVGDSSSDNDEDSNKSSSTYSSKDRHFLAWRLSIIWTNNTYQSKHTRQKSLPGVHDHEDPWYHSKTNYLQHTNQFQSYHQQTMTNHHINNSLKTKQRYNLHRYQGLMTSNEETSSKVNTSQLIRSTVHEMKTDRNKVLRSGEHAER